ncbi:XapX domain-containing protein [Bacillus shivajii]|uniref:XapX domain-containing protein n=1 Tax=Bacillus shivajii TaxID=1983719 RepID=UPI001CF93313|nr:XapX domain-containing protein [Bacillus shivajii]UCZ52874.1 XapX domain-containing protein [Bacillus shivajii]
MIQILLAIISGIIVGFLFALIKLPVPAPPAISGIAGILGIYLGYKLYNYMIPFIDKL